MQEALSKLVYRRATSHTVQTQRELQVAYEYLGSRKLVWEHYGIDFVVDNQLQCWMVDFNTMAGMRKGEALGGLIVGQFKEMLQILTRIHANGTIGDTSQNEHECLMQPDVQKTFSTKEDL